MLLPLIPPCQWDGMNKDNKERIPPINISFQGSPLIINKELVNILKFSVRVLNIQEITDTNCYQKNGVKK